MYKPSLHSSRLRLIVLMLLLALLPFVTFAQTEFEGEVSGEWTVDDSPYIQVGAASVPADVTLEIRPGVTVVLHEEEAFFIAGVIQAVGEEDNLISFIHPEDAIGQGISIESEANETIHFEYCFFDSLDEAIEARRTKMFISHCSFYYCVDAVDCAHVQAEVTNCYSESDQQQVGDFMFGLNGEPGGYYIITNNVFDLGFMSQDITIRRADSVFVSGNEANLINISRSDNIEIIDNNFGDIRIDRSSPVRIEDNEITGTISIGSSEADVLNNTSGRIRYSTGRGLMRNNTTDDINIILFSSVNCINNIGEDISVSQSNSIINRNELQGLSVMDNSEVSFYNNTIYSPEEDDWLVELIESTLVFRNNIVYTGDESKYGIQRMGLQLIRWL